MPSTIKLHRVFAAPPERVYKAFIDVDAKCKWLPPNGFTARMHEDDARVGGKYRMSFTNFTTGSSHAFGGEYVELTPAQRIRYTDKFDDPNLPGSGRVCSWRKPRVWPSSWTRMLVSDQPELNAVPSMRTLRVERPWLGKNARARYWPPLLTGRTSNTTPDWDAVQLASNSER